VPAAVTQSSNPQTCCRQHWITRTPIRKRKRRKLSAIGRTCLPGGVDGSMPATAAMAVTIVRLARRGIGGTKMWVTKLIFFRLHDSVQKLYTAAQNYRLAHAVMLFRLHDHAKPCWMIYRIVPDRSILIQYWSIIQWTYNCTGWHNLQCKACVRTFK
jgi:hypothetical protein